MGPTPLSPLPTAPHASLAPRSDAPAARPKLRREDLGGERGRSGGRTSAARVAVTAEDEAGKDRRCGS